MWELNGLGDFFGTMQNFISDPTVVYDKSADVFFASIVNVPAGSVHVVGFDPDDLQNRRIKVINFGACPDQTWLTVSADKVGLSTNLFEMGCPANSYLGGKQVLFNKGDMLREGTVQPLIESRLIEEIPLFGARPAKSFAASPDVLFVSVGDGSEAGDFLTIFRYAGQGSDVQLTETPIRISNVNIPPNARQPFGIPLDTGSARVQSAALSPDNKNLWVAFMDACFGCAKESVVVRLIQIDLTNGKVIQDFRFGNPEFDFIFPALAVTSDNHMVLTFGITSPTQPPSIAVTGQAAGSLPETMEQVIIIKNGNTFTQASCEAACRWGDYNGAAVDADLAESNSVWVTGQYTLQPDIWGTLLGKISVN
jgi:hypothetical protein